MEIGANEKRTLLVNTIGVAAAFALLFCLLAAIAGQDGNWDLYNYHYYNAYAFLNDRFWIDVQPAQRQTFFSPFLDIPFYFFAESLGILAASLSYATFQSLQGPVLFLLFYIFLRRGGSGPRTSLSLAIVLAAIAVLSPMNLRQVGTTYGDSTTSVFVLSGLALFLSAVTPEYRPPKNVTRNVMLILSAGLVGISVGLKLTNGPYLVALVLCTLFLPVGFKSKTRIFLLTAASGLIGFFVAYGYWGWFLFDEFQNPFFPQLNNIFKSDFIKAVAFTDDRYKATTWHGMMFYPFYYNVFAGEISQQRFLDLRLPLAYVSIAAVLIAMPFRSAVQKRASNWQPYSTLLSFFSIAYIFWLLIFSITRYALALEVLTPLVVLVACSILVGRGWIKAILVSLALLPLAGSAILNLANHSFGIRTAWTNTAFEVVFPPVDLADSMVLISGGQAMSFIIPSAPKSTRFVRIDSNLFYVGFKSLEERYDNKMGQRIRKSIGSHEGQIYSLFSDGEASQADYELAVFKLKRVPDSCNFISSKGGPKLTLCRAQHFESP